MLGALPAALVEACHALELVAAGELHDLGLDMKLDIRHFFDALDQIARHRFRERLATHEDMHSARGAREIHRGLTCGVSATDDDDLGVVAEARLDRSRAVVDADTFEPLERLER